MKLSLWEVRDVRHQLVTYQLALPHQFVANLQRFPSIRTLTQEKKKKQKKNDDLTFINPSEYKLHSFRRCTFPLTIYKKMGGHLNNADKVTECLPNGFWSLSRSQTCLPNLKSALNSCPSED